MLTTGSKYFFGFALFAFVAALVYGGATSGHQMDMDTLVGVISLGYKGSVGDQFGYSVLIALFGTSLFLGTAAAAFRDADPDAEAQVLQLDAVPAVQAPRTASYWPIISAFGATVLMIGFVVSKPLAILGVGILLVSAFEWASSAWAERATGDPAINKAIRHRVLFPIEVPLLAVVGIAVMVLSVSRILLALPKTGSYIVFGAVPAVILGIGWLITAKPKLNRNLITVMLLIGGVAILAGGIVGAEHGPRKEKPSGTHEGGLAPLAPGAPVVVQRSTGTPA